MHPWTFSPEGEKPVKATLLVVNISRGVSPPRFFGARPVEVCLAIIIDVAVQF